ncbi:transcription elongation factor GreA [Candidatus Shapirobacteria bacterium CG09_land_8_20_14_0_10_38_17]|uniref:Transcription elongation factor GreA n=1 Tax=Candidatus Shapirobacteria bacterium CG09_land_8_20_14_0_10_38_17 TaxID=1974884 RepID=A0A2H0WRK9_9BACT|nr:MAG: transcription elongation factor GreA [Candidatus Shapirobacteria bacterium CG09_land_8_20_14_0_10_38_17]
MIMNAKNFDNQVRLITKEGFENLRKKLLKLEDKRPYLVDRLEHARSMGDLAENSEYHSAKEDLEFLDRQIDESREAITHLRVAQNRNDHSRVLLGCRVKVVADDGKQIVFMIVGDYESDPLKGKISYSSPLGKALFEKRVGDKAMVKTPNGIVHYKILAIN